WRDRYDSRMRTSWLVVAVVLGSCVVQPSSPPPQYGTRPPNQGGYGQPGYGQPGYTGGGAPTPGVSCGTGNIALNKPARQSSTSGWSKPNDAQGAVDGQKTGGYGFHTSEEANPWWEVDLGQDCAIGQIVIY